MQLLSWLACVPLQSKQPKVRVSGSAEEVDLQCSWDWSHKLSTQVGCKNDRHIVCRVSKHLSKVSNVWAQSSVDPIEGCLQLQMHNQFKSTTEASKSANVDIKACFIFANGVKTHSNICLHQSKTCHLTKLSFINSNHPKVLVWSPTASDPHIQRTTAIELSPKTNGKSSDSTLHTPNLSSIWTNSNWSSKDSQKNHSDWQQHPSASPHAKESNQKCSVPVCVVPLWRWAQNTSPSCLVSSFFLQSTERWNLMGRRFQQRWSRNAMITHCEVNKWIDFPAPATLWLANDICRGAFGSVLHKRSHSADFLAIGFSTTLDLVCQCQTANNLWLGWFLFVVHRPSLETHFLHLWSNNNMHWTCHLFASQICATQQLPKLPTVLLLATIQKATGNFSICENDGIIQNHLHPSSLALSFSFRTMMLCCPLMTLLHWHWQLVGHTSKWSLASLEQDFCNL